jgi:hypothetical protein
MRKIIEQCPSCGGDLIVTALHCAHCDTGITGRYQPSLFDRLSAPDLRFVESFVLSKGNIKEMERELGVSYWSIRNRLNDVVEALEALIVPPAPAPAAAPAAVAPIPAPETTPREQARLAAARQEILDQLAAGDLTPEEAAAHLAAVPDEE